MNMQRTSYRTLQKVIRSLASLLVFPGACLAQDFGGEWKLLHRLTGDSTLTRGLGRSLANVGDFDRDGHDDLIVGAPLSQANGIGGAGSVLAYSGKSGTVLLHIDGLAYDGRLGSTVAGAGDVDADGISDLMAAYIGTSPSYTGQGTVLVYSGSDGRLLHTFQGGGSGDQLGWSLAGAGDLDGDGHDDVVAGAPHWPSAWGGPDQGYIVAYSGRTGGQLYIVWGSGLDDRLGSSVASIEDLDGDGIRDLLIGGPGADPGSLVEAGVVRVLSGATGALIRQLDGPAVGGHFGQAVDRIGDIDGDGFEDILAAAPSADIGGQANVGCVYLVSSSTNQLLYRFVGIDGMDQLGNSVAGTKDIDGDGFDDVLIGAATAGAGPVTGEGAAYLFSGKTGMLLRQFSGKAQFDFYGQGVAALDDKNVFGNLSIAIGADGYNINAVNDVGLVEIHSYDPLLHLSSGELSASSGQDVDLTLDFPASEAGVAYTLLASTTGTGPTLLGGIEVPLSPGALLSLTLSGWTPPNALGWRGALDAAGNATSVLQSTPALGPLLGRTGYLAAVSYDAGTQTARKSSIARLLEIVP